MKKILITGANSYIGTSFEKWVSQWPDQYAVETVDMIGEDWKSKSFADYDTVFHVAGIAHVKETRKNRDSYFKVNRDLAVETAKKAKAEGVRHFIFLSSMNVYGLEKGVIHANTIPAPKTAYGKSKYEAEGLLSLLSDDSFTLSILRPPMVYGKGCKGNYQRLVRFMLKTPFFPDIENQRSMIYINNLSQFFKQLIDDPKGGVLFPQNSEYVSTTEMAVYIAEAHNKTIKKTKTFNWIVKILNFGITNKVFGDLTYDMSMSDPDQNYNVCGFRESILNTEQGKDS
jgi:UDP-glucose 4-epimerase